MLTPVSVPATPSAAPARPGQRHDGWQRAAVAGGVLLVTAIVTLFVYNSGFGYDGMEVLFVSRAIADGHGFFEFPPAKPFGIYALVAVPSALFRPVPHWVVTTLVVTLLGAAVTAGYWHMRRHGLAAARLTALLILIAGLFMELNYLVVEGVVAAAGFVAAELLARSESGRRGGYMLAAGAVIGAAFWFKQTAALYGIGALIWLTFLTRRQGGWPRGWTMLAAGWLIATLPIVGYFAAVGQWSPFVEWTFAMPAQIAASDEFLGKFVSKIFWLPPTLLAAFVFSLVGPVRRVWRDPACSLLLCLAIPAAYPIVKSQAPHYVFPAAAMALAWAAVVFVTAGRLVAVRRAAALLAGGFAALVMLSVVLYRPEALSRLTTVSRFEDEEQLRKAYLSVLPEGGSILFVTPDALRKYALTGRYPNVPVFHTDSQAEYLLRRDPELLMRALEDPNLTAVEFDPRQPPALRFDRIPVAEREAMWVRFHRTLRTSFRRSQPGNNVWVRR